MDQASRPKTADRAPASGGDRTGFVTLTGGDFLNAGGSATTLKSTIIKLGYSQDSARRAAVAAFEAEMNVIIHAVAGTLQYEIGTEEVLITVTDIGPGIPDVGLAMKEGYSTAPTWAKQKGWGSGLGLPNIKKNADDLAIETVPGEGTTLRIKVSLTRE